MIPAMPQSRHQDEPAHDVLAAEAFAVPGPDPSLRHPTVLPDDPSGIPEAHDILAAEEFAMPAPSPGADGRRRSALAKGADSPRGLIAGLFGALAGALLLRRHRR